MRRASAQVDFDDAARQLFASLGLDANGAVKGATGFRSLYNPLDLMWKDPATGGKIYVGNQQAAQNAALLKREGITHVVNCTDNMPLYHEGTFDYYRFNVTFWGAQGNSDTQLANFMQPMFDFVDRCLAAGGSVLVHCLAGAHRAGTTGCILLMKKQGFNAQVAVQTAKTLRPVIDPIGRFPELLRRFEGINATQRAAITAKPA